MRGRSHHKPKKGGPEPGNLLLPTSGTSPRSLQTPMASWTLGASGSQNPAPSPCPVPVLVPIQGSRHTPSLPGLEPAPEDRPRFAVFGSASKSETIAAEEDNSLLAFLPTQQLRPPGAGGGHTSLVFRSSPFSLWVCSLSSCVCLLPKRGASAKGPVKAALFWASLGPGSLFNSFLGKCDNVISPLL